MCETIMTCIIKWYTSNNNKNTFYILKYSYPLFGKTEQNDKKHD